MSFEKFYRAYVKAPDHPGKQRIERWLGGAFLPAAGGRFVVDGDVALRLHPRDWIEYVLIRDAQYEPLTLRFLQQNLQSGHRAMLAGINFGLHVVSVSRAVGPSGVVIGVDPQVQAICRTSDHLKLNHAPANVRLVPAALGRSSGVVVVDDPPADNAGNANLRTKGSGPACVLCTRIADLWRLVQGNDGSPDLVLLDVEGFEGEVLEGFDEQFRPGLMVIELRDTFLREVGSSAAVVCERLSSMGYALYTLDGRTATAGDDLPEHNAVAVHASRGPVQFVNDGITGGA
jgi:FkbM family methyltransferase